MSVSAKTPEGAKEVEDFYGVYLLYCTNPKYKGRTYIGYTVNPNRRISQHNRGAHAGGAWRTSNRGPWEMVLIIHGFPNDISALRFEWAWQHPKSSRRLNGLPPKKSREKTFEYCLRLLASMLNLGPWNKLALTVRWLKPEFKVDFPVDVQPPLHMPIVSGPVKSKKVSRVRRGGPELIADHVDDDDDPECNVCSGRVRREDRLVCLYPRCGAVTHILCLAGEFTRGRGQGEPVVPVSGACPTCGGEELWGNLVRKRRGCYEELEQSDEDSGDD